MCLTAVLLTTTGSLGVVDNHLAEPRRRRALALDKYRKKRNNLRFAKTIRYESRKQLAQTRPRVKGQFVKNQAGGGDYVGGVNEGRGNAGGGAEEEDMYEGEEDDDDDDVEEDMTAAHRDDDAQARYGGQNFNVSLQQPSNEP